MIDGVIAVSVGILTFGIGIASPGRAWTGYTQEHTSPSTCIAFSY